MEATEVEWEQAGNGQPGGELEHGGLVFVGDGEQLSLNVGGQKPTDAKLRVVGGAFDVDGEFKKGQVIVYRLELQITEVSAKDHLDRDTLNVTGCTRGHKATVIGAERMA